MSFAKSRACLERAKKTLAGGTSSVFRKHQRPTPIFFTHGKGSRVWDVDGHEFIDYTLAYGPQILGHSHPALVKRVCDQIALGQTFGAQNELEFLLAERLVALLPGCDRVTYASTGSEAVQVALRLGRAHTGRQKVIRFSGHYHGWMDNVLVQAPDVNPLDTPRGVSAGQAPGSLQDILCLPWNDLPVLQAALDRYHDQIAAIIMEPFLANGGGIAAKPGYLQGVRQLCDKAGIVLIFDEVISGFRVGMGGAAALYGVTPDLAVYGKALAGGFPLSVVAGKAAVMDRIAEGRVFHAGTLNGNPVSLCAALATVDELGRNDGEALHRTRALGERLQEGIRQAFAAAGKAVVVQGLGSVFWTYLRNSPVEDHKDFSSYDAAPYADFIEALLDEGTLAMPSGRWYVSAAHNADDITQTIAAIERTLRRPSLASLPSAGQRFET